MNSALVRAIAIGFAERKGSTGEGFATAAVVARANSMASRIFIDGASSLEKEKPLPGGTFLRRPTKFP